MRTHHALLLLLAGACADAGPPGADHVPSDPAEAQRALSDFLDALGERGDAPFPTAWRQASAADFARAGALIHAIAGDTWLEDVATAEPAQLDAVEELAAASVGQLRLEWNDARGTPGAIHEVGFVRRGVEPRAVWDAFAAQRGGALAELYGLGAADQLVVAETVDAGATAIVRLERRWHGFVVDGQLLDAHVTTATSPLGDGYLAELTGALDRDLGARLPATPPSAWLDEDDARALAGDGVLTAELRIVCGAACQPLWIVRVEGGRELLIDAASGDLVADGSYSHHGTLKGPSYTPGAAAAPVPVKLRGSEIRTGGVYVGGTSLADGSHALTSSAAHTVDLVGPRPTGTWPRGRVDRRLLGSWNTIQNSTRTWTPSTEPNRDFTTAWARDDAKFERHSATVFGWLNYWQQMFSGLTVQIPGTASYMTENGGGGCQTGVLSTGAPGSGQTTWGQLGCRLNTTDTLPAPIGSMALLGHEFGGHVVGICNMVAGDSCTLVNPQNGPRPSTPGAWRSGVWGASIENLANLYGTVLTQFRNPGQSGFGGFNLPYSETWNYDGYQSTTDSLGTIAQDSAGVIDCLATGVSCPSTHACVMSPRSPHGNGRGVCARRCTSSCAGGLFCTAAATASEGLGVIPSVNVCWADDYMSNWFTTVGSRLALDAGWDNTLKWMTLAGAGNSGNGLRDFVGGTDSWYTTLLNLSIDDDYEITRAVRSAAGPTVTAATAWRDDFTNRFSRAVPMTVVDEVGTEIVLGGATSGYPIFNGTDPDRVLFRGVAGARYEISADPVAGSPVDLNITVHRWASGFTTTATTGHNLTGPGERITTDALPATDWYLVTFSNRISTTGGWRGKLRLIAGADDFSAALAEAYPVASGVPISGKLTAGDIDAFKIYVPNTTANLFVTTVASPVVHVEMYDPDGVAKPVNTWGFYNLVPAGKVGYWTFRIKNATTTTAYSVTATLSCATGTAPCDDLSAASTITTRQAWGDRFAGRLASVGKTARYAVALDAYEDASFAITHAKGSGCKFQLDLLPPSVMSYFGGRRITRWTDGAVGRDGGRSPGGHVTAMIPWTYTVEVGLEAGSAGTDCWYRLEIAESDLSSNAMPAW